MLADFELIAFLATTNAARARAFYEGMLGLRFVSEDDFAVVYNAQGIELRLQKIRELAPQPHTALGWSVDGIDKVVRDIAARGGRFERFPQLGQDAAGIWKSPSGARIAWLRDPDGNLLSLTEKPATAFTAVAT
jgi:catechol 2,3-dioxygenase-like lactoylglutathione lyase family enzyme